MTYEKIAANLAGNGCGCDDDATEGCPNWNGERCTFAQFMIAKALADAEQKGRVKGIREVRDLVSGNDEWNWSETSLRIVAALDALTATKPEAGR